MKKRLRKDSIHKNMILLNALLHFYGECNMLEDVREIWEIAKNHKQNIIGYGAII